MFEALSFGFMQNALLAAALASVACGIIGALVVVNRVVFLSGGVAHAAYGGVGLAFFMGWPVLPTTLGFTLMTSGLMAAATLRRSERADTVIGVTWAAGMAMGIILLDLTPGYNVELMSFLFGSILTVPHSELLLMAGLDIVVTGLVLLLYRHLLALSFDPEFARTRGVPVTVLHYLLLAMIAVSVVMIIRVVGLILVIALLTIPPYLAERKAGSLASMMLRSVVLSLAFCLGGLALSYHFNLSSGASIIAVASLFFFLAAGRDMLASKSR
ncbi:ABC-type Mn2+/Zn2+ transport system, permease component [Desulfocurvibacter africanus PCS]|uniref:ABC-type Mn2+/Zn2+ transport system, permease component n=1 Tax=Desulfocurvibacter africanus PCS TaxID=1262666 RepID=M5PWW4_DESAF|nr:metal ABC transporter permease [Desulfocurvibacter africanus]EMG38470.1 ABC-type Mn2+/Zn2+ transport system, permease component [Desulfocurvibacter africanus PCS]